MKKILVYIGMVLLLQQGWAQITVLSNGDVGIGTANPTEKLHVVGNSLLNGGVNILNGNVGIGATANSTDRLYVVGTSILNGNVGIGITSPTQRLHVLGNSLLDGNVGIGSLHPNSNTKLYVDGHTIINGKVNIGTNNVVSQSPVDLLVQGATFLLGNVGIGNTDFFPPPYPLCVAGTTILNGDVGIGIKNPNTRLQVDGGALRIGNTSSSTDRAINMIKIGEGDYVRIGEWEKDNMLSVYAQKGFRFTGPADADAYFSGQVRIGSSHLIFSNSSGHGVINYGNKDCNNPKGDLWFRSLHQAGEINTFDQRMILTYDGILGINTWKPPTMISKPNDLKLYVDGGVWITGVVHQSQNYTGSDERLKTNIRPLTIEEKDKLYLLEGKFYNKIIQIEDNTNLVEEVVEVIDNNGCTQQVRTITENPKQIFQVTEYGYLAQELMAVFPDLVSENAEGYYGVNYIGLIPVIVEAMKDQRFTIDTQRATINQLQIENVQQQAEITQQQAEIGVLQQIAFVQEMDLQRLQNTVNKMQELLNCFCGRGGDINPNCCGSLLHRDSTSSQETNNNNNSIIKQVPILYQNTPNPFSSNTEISCDIPTAFSSAFIYIYNLQGVELMSFPIMQTGYNTVYVYASTLPAGMYLYTLVVDNQIVDTKKMILTK